MPDRVVRQGILTSEDVNKLSWAGEVFYRRLFSRADDFGRYDARPSILRADLYALKLDRVSEPDVVKWMGECSEAGLIRVYTVNNKAYLEVLKFDQRLRAMKSRYPSPDVQQPPSSADRCQQPHADVDRCRLKRNESESEFETETEEKAPLLPVDFSNVSLIYDIETDLLANQKILEGLCMAAGRDLETAKFVLRKYHLTIQEKEEYPKSRAALIAGFKKWLMTENSPNGKQNRKGTTTQQVTTTGHSGL